MIMNMFHNEFSKWTLSIFNEDLQTEWAISMIKSKKRMIIVGALVTLINDIYFDYYWHRIGNIGA